METQKLNIFILADNSLVVNGLRHTLENRFQHRVNVSGFYDSRNCLKKVDHNTQAVVLDYFLEEKSSLATFKCIQAINPKARIIMHSCKEDIINAIEAMFKGETIYSTAMKFRDKSINQFR